MAQAAGLLALPQECLASIVGHVAVAAEEDDAYARYAEDPKPVNALESLNGTCQLLRQLARELLYDVCLALPCFVGLSVEHSMFSST